MKRRRTTKRRSSETSVLSAVNISTKIPSHLFVPLLPPCALCALHLAPKYHTDLIQSKFQGQEITKRLEHCLHSSKNTTYKVEQSQRHKMFCIEQTLTFDITIAFSRPNIAARKIVWIHSGKVQQQLEQQSDLHFLGCGIITVSYRPVYVAWNCTSTHKTRYMSYTEKTELSHHSSVLSKEPEHCGGWWASFDLREAWRERN